MKRRLAVLVLATLLTFIPLPAQAIRSDVECINGYRRSLGLTELKRDWRLERMAQAWAVHLAKTQQLTHDPKLIYQMVDLNATAIGENVGRGAQSFLICAAWKNSPGHNANMMRSDYTHLGVGAAWNGQTIYLVQKFSTTPKPGRAQ